MASLKRDVIGLWQSQWFGCDLAPRDRLV